jgi:hypothetical protein
MTDERPRKAITFKLDRLVEYSDGAILAEIRRVASIIPGGPLTVSIFFKHSRVSRNTVTRRFGSWAKALEAASLTERWSEQMGSPGSVQARIRKMSNDEVLCALRDLAERLGKANLTVGDVESNLPFGGGTLRRRWGTARKAFEAAGIGLTTHGRRYSDEECFKNLFEVWTHYGRPPQYREMGLPPSTVGGKAYVLRFGTWNRALSSFVERVNVDVSPEDALAQDAQLEVGPAMQDHSRGVDKRDAGDTREIPLGLRFRVLYRDRFKCVLCGDSPSINPVCVLHVDHIVPRSKGGRSVLENLRSLCSTCNVGRGNRFVD